MSGSESIDGFDIISFLPPEISQLIFSYLSPKDLGRVSSVSRRWRDLTNCGPLWKRICIKEQWESLDMVEGFKSHVPPALLRKDCDSLEKLCNWRLNYERHRSLPINWERNRSVRFRLTDPRDSLVSCLSCDGTHLLLARENGTVTILNVERLPYFVSEWESLLETKIVQAKISGNFCVIQQHMLIQFFNLTSGSLINAKSFDYGYGFIEFMDRTRWKTRTFKKRYKPAKPKDICISLYEDKVLVAVRDYQCVYVWDRSGKRVDAVHVTNHMCKMRDMVLDGDFMYIIYAASRRIRHIGCYNLNKKEWTYEVTTPKCKTQKLLVADSLLVGVAVAGPGMTCTGVIIAWDRANGKIISERQSAEYLSSRTVTTSYELILYTETTSISLWEPRSNSVLRKVSTNGNPLYIKSLPFTFVALFTDRYAYVWDWFTGARCFRLLSVFNEENGEFIWSDDSTLIIKNEDELVEMIGFC